MHAAGVFFCAQKRKREGRINMIEATISEDSVRTLYPAIISQALLDITDTKSKQALFNIFDVNDFFKSEWGQHLMNVAGVRYKDIDAKYHITDMVQKARKFCRLYGKGWANAEIASETGLPETVIKGYRAEMDKVMKPKRMGRPRRK